MFFKIVGGKTENQNIRIKEMWAIINKKDNFNVLHTHPNCYLSAAYYVKAPEKLWKISSGKSQYCKKTFLS